MDTASCYGQSDPVLNRQFHRRWHEHAPPAPPPAPPAADAEPGMATLQRWVDDWRAERAARSPRKGPAR